LELQYAKRDWFLLRSGSAASTHKLHEDDPVIKALLQEATQQSALWTHASQNTLITPAPDEGRKAKKTYVEAQSSAHATLSLIAEVNATIDDLTIVRDQVSSELIGRTKGISGSWLRIKILGKRLWVQSKGLLDISLFHIGERPVTLGGITKALFIFLFFYAISWLIRHFLDRLERRQHFQQGSFYAGGRVLHYIILTIAGIAALGSIGLDFSNFALIAGALSVGIGFGLQSVVLNFVSGLILLFEGSIRVGDYVELDSNDSESNLMGVVKEIRSRATLINTNDNVDVIVPNAELVGNRMVNWTLKESTARMRIPFSVAYGSDKELVKKAALEAAAEGEFCIHHTPGLKAAVRMISFGDSALNFELRVWVNRQGVRRPIFVRSSILWEMDTRFREYGIKVPFPQRDMHFPDGSGLLRPKQPVPEPTDQ
jgi:small-conductance mechanosensitive channel